MLRGKLLELATTRFLVLTVVCAIILVVGVLGSVVYFQLAQLDSVAKFTDSVFKTVAMIVGTLWALNRYFVLRTDAPQFRVDCDVGVIHAQQPQDDGMLFFRLDLVNTGKAQIGAFNHFVSVEAVSPVAGKIELTTLHRWPDAGWHPGGPIEPGSWAAINDEFCCPSSVRAVRMFVAVALSETVGWTWHKTYDISGDTR